MYVKDMFCIEHLHQKERKSIMENICRMIAREYGTTPQEVHREIMNAISAAKYSDSKIARKHWDKLCSENASPSPEEVLVYLCKMVNKKLT